MDMEAIKEQFPLHFHVWDNNYQDLANLLDTKQVSYDSCEWLNYESNANESFLSRYQYI